MNYSSAATPIDQEEMQDLILLSVLTCGELNYVEAENICKAVRWAFVQPPKNLISPEFIRKLHRRMFNEVWKWAGQYRKTEKNIGVIAWNISTEVYKLCEDVQAQISHKSYLPDELAARFHHKLGYIHPFPNGNGRLSRTMTDLLLSSLGEQHFTWGKQNLSQANDTRDAYLKALRAADEHNYTLLLDFVRS